MTAKKTARVVSRRIALPADVRRDARAVLDDLKADPLSGLDTFPT